MAIIKKQSRKKDNIMNNEMVNLIEWTKTWKLRWFIPEGRYGVYQCQNSSVSVIVFMLHPSDYFIVVDRKLLHAGIEDLQELCTAISKQIRDRKKQGFTPEDVEYLRRIQPLPE
jgi:hypothetical protein